jgi:hypothetical protein
LYFCFFSSENTKIKFYQTLILPIAAREFKTFVSQIKEKYRLRIFENVVLRGILYRKGKEGNNRRAEKLHIEQLYDFYSSPDIFGTPGGAVG